MNTKRPLIYLVDDNDYHAQAMSEFLGSEGYRIQIFLSAKDFLSQRNILESCDLVISDINMPEISGFDLCRYLRALPESVRLPIILVTGNDPETDRARGLEVGADEFISKPFSPAHLMAKIRSLLDIRARDLKRLQELEQLQGLNIELGRFVSPNVVHQLTDHQMNFLKPHRAEVTVLFADLRGFTAFSEKVEPEEVLDVLQKYYTAVGTAAMKYKGTLGHLAGDGIMIFFNDPVPMADHRESAVCMALEAREALLKQKCLWDERNYNIDFGMGLSEGFATIGGIGFERFSQYSVIGNVANFAARLCQLAVEGQILISQRFFSRLKPETCRISTLGDMSLKGIEKPVTIHNIESFPRKINAA